MLWNDLEYVNQVKIIDKIVELLEKEDNSDIQDGLIAAIHELEIWSNSPRVLNDEPFVAIAGDPYEEEEYD